MITIDRLSRVISVPKNYMSVVQTIPFEIRELDLNQFRLDLREIDYSEEGITYPDTHIHNTSVSVGGVVLARVLIIINGYTITFEDDSYAVNLVGLNSNVADVTNLNQVSVRSSNSAGLAETQVSGLTSQESSILDIIRYQVHAVHVNTDLVVNGDGSFNNPFNNFVSAADYAETKGIIRILLYSDATIDRNLKNFTIEGVGDPTIDFNDNNIDKSHFRFVSLTGTYSGKIVADKCILEDGLNGLNGHFLNCGLNGKLTCASGSDVVLFNPHSHISGLSRPEVDMNGGVCNLSIRGMSGGLIVSNSTNSLNTCTVEMESGRLLLESTITDGEFSVRGSCQYTDNSTVTPNVDGLVAEQIWSYVINGTKTAKEWITKELLTFKKFFALK